MRTLIMIAMVLPSVFCGDALGAYAIRRRIQGVSTGMTVQEALEAAVRHGGKCHTFLGGSPESAVFSCSFDFDRTSLLVRKTNHMDLPRVTSIDYSFMPTDIRKGVILYLRPRLDVEHEVGPDGQELPSWRPLKSGEAVRTQCWDKDQVPGNIPSPPRCILTVTDERLRAADRDIGFRRE